MKTSCDKCDMEFTYKVEDGNLIPEHDCIVDYEYYSKGNRMCECGKKLQEDYRFTDWYNDSNDKYGTFEECLEMFKKAVEENPEGRYSIYDVSGCEDCGESFDEGIIFNENLY